jgi:hypothetical protein
VSQKLEDGSVHHLSAHTAARRVCLGIAVIYITICSFAVSISIGMENQKNGFHAIKVTQPIAYFDQSDMDNHLSLPNPDNQNPK